MADNKIYWGSLVSVNGDWCIAVSSEKTQEIVWMYPLVDFLEESCREHIQFRHQDQLVGLRELIKDLRMIASELDYQTKQMLLDSEDIVETNTEWDH